MTPIEIQILQQFRRYRVRAREMLFFKTNPTKLQDRRFLQAIESLVERGLVVKERRHYAYSLTSRGYLAAMSA